MTDAEYPLAACLQADASNYRKAGRSSYRYIVIHCTDGHEMARPVAEMWQQPKHGSSAHFVVGQDGAVFQCVSLADVAWHAHAVNSSSVGIEHSARTPGELSATDPGSPPSQALYDASAKLVAWLLRRVGLTPSRDTIQGHAEIDPATTHEDCPLGCGWDWDRYMAAVQKEYDAWELVA
jgi:N-acetyl-anhydromuramyl-L-alanine amidase AmpD